MSVLDIQCHVSGITVKQKISDFRQQVARNIGHTPNILWFHAHFKPRQSVHFQV